MFAEDNVDKDDISYVAGHCFRTISCLNQVLFAVNEVYCINEKKAVAMVDDFHGKPENYKQKVDAAFSKLSSSQQSTREAVEIIRKLVTKTKEIVNV